MSSRRRLFEDIHSETDDSQNAGDLQDVTVEVTESEARNYSLHTVPSSQLREYVCTSCQRMFIQKNIKLFDEKNYDGKNSTIQQFLSKRFKVMNKSEFICKPCHRALSNNKPKLPRHLNSTNRTLNIPYVPVLIKCCICHGEHHEKQILGFNIDNYNRDSPMLKRTFGESNPCISNSKVCKQCHTKLIRHSLVTCSLCKKDIKRYNALIWKNAQQLPIEQPVSCGPNKQWTCKPCHSTLVDEIICMSCDKKCPKHKTIRYRESKYDMTDNLVQTTLCGATNGSDYICSDCDRKLTATNVCTCCHEKFNLYRVILFEVQNYDFENYIVSQALGHRFVHGDTEYICKTCNQNLKSSNDHMPRMPRKAVAKKTTLQGAKFLQAIHEKPEFVCTCCHRWLFHRSIMPFDEGKYNMSNDIVKETLDVKFRHPMHVTIFKGTRSAHEHPIDYGDSDSESDSESDVNMPCAQQSITNQNTTVVKKYEYICITCHNSLK